MRFTFPGGEIPDPGTQCECNPGRVPGRAVVPWELSVQQGVLGSLAPATRRAYERAVAGYREFTLTCGTLTPFPLTGSSTLRYLFHLQGSGFASKTMRVRLSGLAFFTKLQGSVGPG